MPRPIHHLCHGCDAEKAATDFCANCEEVTPVYPYDGSSEAFQRQASLISRIQARKSLPGEREVDGAQLEEAA